MHLDKFDIDSIAIGTFDGIHKGHKELLKKLTKKGALLVIQMNKKCLTPGIKRSQYSKFPCFYYDFELIKNMSGDEFIDALCNDFVNLKTIVVGCDFRFGKNRVCDTFDLKNFFSGKTIVVDEFKIDGIGVHSSNIKKFLKDGKIYEANKFLGREYCIEGNVIKGQGIGKKEIYPTLNLYIKDYILPKDGVYSARARINKKYYDCVTFIGNRVSSDNNFAVETHIIDENINEKVDFVELYFVDYIRDNAKFSSFCELKKQISIDIQKSKIMLENSKQY
ncbi:bifunctional riboflavin kinase/FAD synthetase [Campylobacter sp. RM12327]|nr:bifunctional riboflavin kinase / FMN adenylyltransferase [Campylobacter sputorum]MBE7358118.1 bifunctional riboflavin kinase/FAD synthetase [Campylobacter sp. RM11302]MBF6668930.1 bifunctional riboflavin kinase/FAD synthetase [Campylobacter sp. RM12327]MBF6673844.1 bifunctional riboflavin kinase/FAD synthetase [Campylobacter sp. RM13538]MBF6676734.1 bifunctional riboflavin kinase/FAD synthetase [Campylobacter sp. RM12321]MBF6677659.1 bifunctional riboflavin kinase/FAD synthetase [Campylobac